MIHIVISGAALTAVTLAVFIGLAVIQEPSPVGMLRILRASFIAAMFIVMALMMISYLFKKLEMKKPL